MSFRACSTSQKDWAYFSAQRVFSSVAQFCPTLCDPMDAHQVSLSITNFRSLLKRMSIESIMPSNHLILCHPLLLLPLIFAAPGSFPMSRLLRVLWTARGSNQSILKEINPEYSLEGLILELKLQYFGYLMQRAISLLV